MTFEQAEQLIHLAEQLLLLLHAVAALISFLIGATIAVAATRFGRIIA